MNPGVIVWPASTVSSCYGSHVSNLPERHPVRAAIALLVWGLAPAAVFGTNQPCSIATVFHRPCPGCGLTRATLLFLRGDVRASLAMHALAIPMIACWAAIAAATIHATWVDGAPWQFFRRSFGRGAAIATVVAYVALFALWALREEGFFGGRVPV